MGCLYERAACVRDLFQRLTVEPEGANIRGDGCSTQSHDDDKEQPHPKMPFNPHFGTASGRIAIGTCVDVLVKAFGWCRGKVVDHHIDLDRNKPVTTGYAIAYEDGDRWIHDFRRTEFRVVQEGPDGGDSLSSSSISADEALPEPRSHEEEEDEESEEEEMADAEEGGEPRQAPPLQPQDGSDSEDNEGCAPSAGTTTIVNQAVAECLMEAIRPGAVGGAADAVAQTPSTAAAPKSKRAERRARKKAAAKDQKAEAGGAQAGGGGGGVGCSSGAGGGRAGKQRRKRQKQAKEAEAERRARVEGPLLAQRYEEHVKLSSCAGGYAGRCCVWCHESRDDRLVLCDECDVMMCMGCADPDEPILTGDGSPPWECEPCRLGIRIGTLQLSFEPRPRRYPRPEYPREVRPTGRISSRDIRL